jgi:hypothetical protein
MLEVSLRSGLKNIKYETVESQNIYKYLSSSPLGSYPQFTEHAPVTITASSPTPFTTPHPQRIMAEADTQDVYLTSQTKAVNCLWPSYGFLF